jgi:hypothetical protein
MTEPDYEQAMQLAEECLAELGIELPPMSVDEFRAAFEDMWGPGFPLGFDGAIVGQFTADELSPRSGLCKDCGDPLNAPGLMQRCRGRHQAVRT